MKPLISSTDRATVISSIGKELYASNLYKHIANKLQQIGYFGAQKFFLKESADELEHYQIWVDFLNDMLDVAEVPAVPAIKVEITDLMTAFETAFKTEIELGEFYKSFMDETENGYVMQRLLRFVKIQKDSIGEYGDLIARLKLCGGNTSALLLFDSELK